MENKPQKQLQTETFFGLNWKRVFYFFFSFFFPLLFHSSSPVPQIWEILIMNQPRWIISHSSLNYSTHY